MKGILTFSAGMGLASALLLSNGQIQTVSELRPEDLKSTLTSMGFEPREIPDNGGWEVKTTREGYEIPIAVAVSRNGRKLWMTVFLGEFPAKLKTDSTKMMELLRKNFEIQPSHFFITTDGKGADLFKIGLGVDNRGLNPSIIRRELDKISDDVMSSKPIWEG